jgi:NADP-dependent 3-hydroxy acid dehydrogenase YdfG
MTSLDQRIILVTGASTGFGRAIAIGCARAGAQVALVARGVEKLDMVAKEISLGGGKAIVCPCDASDGDQVQATVDRVSSTLGPVEVLVNNAGMNIPSRTIRDTSIEQWRQLIEVNLTAAYLFTKSVLPGMIDRGAGTIVNIASRAANYPSLLAGVGYSSAKIGVQALTRVTNEEGNPFGVRACVINPGVGNTPIVDHRPQPPSQAAREAMIQPEDVAAAVMCVLSLPQRVNVESLDLNPTNVNVS